MEFNFRKVNMPFDRKVLYTITSLKRYDYPHRALLKLTREKSQIWAKFLGDHDTITLSSLKQFFVDYTFKDIDDMVDNAKFSIFYFIEIVLVGGPPRWLVRLNRCQLIEHNKVSNIYL